MYILIDLNKMCVRYKHTNSTILSNLMHLEFPHCTAVVMPEDLQGCYKTFSDMELRLLYTNLCGQKFEGFDRHSLMCNVIALCDLVPESTLNQFEVAAQAAYVKDGDLKYYSYVPGSYVPKLQPDLYTPNAVATVAGYTPTQYTAPVQQTAPASTPQAARVFTPHTPAAPKAPSTPRDHTSAGSSPEGAPKAGSKTGMVWQIADSLYTEGADFKSLRKQVIDACEAEGINVSTASVQWGKWKQTKTQN